MKDVIERRLYSFLETKPKVNIIVKNGNTHKNRISATYLNESKPAANKMKVLLTKSFKGSLKLNLVTK
jgi:hypothetical protein